MTWQSHVIAFLEASLVRPFLLVAAVSVILSAWRLRHPASQHAVWTTVLVGMLLLPVVSTLAPHWTLRVLPARRALDIKAVLPPAPAGVLSVPSESSSFGGDRVVAQPRSAGWSPSAVEELVLWIYALGAGAMVAYFLIGWLFLRRIVSRSRRLHSDFLRESDDVVSPITVGLLRRAVVLPAGWRRWDTFTRRAVLAHEFAHLRRGDTATAALGCFVRSVFWFHPVAWWTARRTADLAEFACDTVVVDRIGDPAGYSRVLVAFAKAVSRSGRSVVLPGLAMATRSVISRRVEHILTIDRNGLPAVRRSRLWLVGVGLPTLCLSATVSMGAATPHSSVGAQTPADVPESASRPSHDTAMAAAASVVSSHRAGHEHLLATIQAAQTAGPSAPSPIAISWPTKATAGDLGQIPLTPGSAATQAAAGAAASDQKVDVVVSVRPCLNQRPGSTFRPRLSPGYVVWNCESLAQFVFEAYAGRERPLLNTFIGELPGLPASVRGGPSWAYTDTFAIEAKGEAISAVTLTPMLRALLEDRFQLKVRRLTAQQQDMYAMTVSKDGLNSKTLQTTKPGDCLTSDERRTAMAADPRPRSVLPACGSISFNRDRNTKEEVWTGATLHDFARGLPALGVDRYVIDQTGINDTFNFTLKASLDDPGFPPSDPEWIWHELEKMGLKLTRTKAPEEYLQIDHAERPRVQ